MQETKCLTPQNEKRSKLDPKVDVFSLDFLKIKNI
jgi:hypothetical protein